MGVSRTSVSIVRDWAVIEPGTTEVPFDITRAPRGMVELVIVEQSIFDASVGGQVECRVMATLYVAEGKGVVVRVIGAHIGPTMVGPPLFGSGSNEKAFTAVVRLTMWSATVRHGSTTPPGSLQSVVQSRRWSWLVSLIRHCTHRLPGFRVVALVCV